jgi:translocator protein
MAFALFFAVTWLAAIIGMRTSQNAPLIYAKMVQPVWAPPSWLFGPVWSLLYCLMAIAVWRVWTKVGLRDSVVVYLVHLIFQALWSGLFFGLSRADLAFIDIVILWAMILWLCVSFWRVDRLAGSLMAPYLAWVSFAMALNAALWFLNGAHFPR